MASMPFIMRIWRCYGVLCPPTDLPLQCATSSCFFSIVSCSYAPIHCVHVLQPGNLRFSTGKPQNRSSILFSSAGSTHTGAIRWCLKVCFFIGPPDKIPPAKYSVSLQDLGHLKLRGTREVFQCCGLLCTVLQEGQDRTPLDDRTLRSSPVLILSGHRPGSKLDFDPIMVCARC